LNHDRNWLIRAALMRNFRAATPVVLPHANVQAIARWRRDMDRNQFDQSIRSAAVFAAPAMRSSTRTSLLD